MHACPLNFVMRCRVMVIRTTTSRHEEFGTLPDSLVFSDPDPGGSGPALFNAFKNHEGFEYIKIVKNQEYGVNSSTAIYKLNERLVRARAKH